MGIALGIVSRNRYLTGQQKLVQARVYAQALTVGVLLATAAFEVGDANQGKGRWETVKIIDPDDPEHKRVIEKEVHHERYQGEDLWKGESDSLTVPALRPLLTSLCPLWFPSLHSFYSTRLSSLVLLSSCLSTIIILPQPKESDLAIATWRHSNAAFYPSSSD